MTTTDTGRKPRQRRDLARMPEFRIASQPLEVRAGTGANDGLVEVSGMVIRYGTPYEVYDMWGSFTETIHYGACTALLEAPTLDVRFLLNHKDLPLARTGAEASLVLTDSQDGLLIRALIDPRMSAAQDLVVCLERKTVTQMSIGMEVDPDGDVWSGADDYGMPDIRNIYRLANVFDVSAVTFPASPTTTIELAQRMWGAVPVESRERTRRLWSVARDARAGRSLSQADADALMHALEELATVDTAVSERSADADRPGIVEGEPRAEEEEDVRSEERATPTPQDPGIAEKIAAAHSAVSEALGAQSQDQDANTDPVDQQVWSHLSDAQDALTAALQSQSQDGAPDAPEDDESRSTDGDDDGTLGGGSGNAPGIGNDDGTGSRSLLIDIDSDLLALSRRPA